VLGDRRTALAWVEEVTARRVSAAEDMTGGWTSTMLALTLADGERLVLRLMDRQPWRTHAEGLLRREADVQCQLADTDIPAPVSVAVDPAGADAGTPAHLMSWLPGELELRRCDGDLLTRLAQLLVAIHAVTPIPRPRAYQSWAPPAKRVVPPWSRRPGLWRQAFSVLEQAPPVHAGVFLHRDFHLGNVLWRDGRVTGVVDWVETSWGPAQLDVAHARSYLAMLHGPDIAEEFGRTYDRLAGAHPDRGYWDVLDIVGYLPGPEKVVTPWHERQVDVGPEQAKERLEIHLATVLAGAR